MCNALLSTIERRRDNRAHDVDQNRTVRIRQSLGRFFASSGASENVGPFTISVVEVTTPSVCAFPMARLHSLSESKMAPHPARVAGGDRSFGSGEGRSFNR